MRGFTKGGRIWTSTVLHKSRGRVVHVGIEGCAPYGATVQYDPSPLNRNRKPITGAYLQKLADEAEARFEAASK